MRRDGTVVYWGWNQRDRNLVPPHGLADAQAAVVGEISFAMVLGRHRPLRILASAPVESAPEWSSRTLSVEAAGFDLKYQWQTNGTDVPGATWNFLRLQGIRPHQAVTYSVRVCNALGCETVPMGALMVTADVPAGTPVPWGIPAPLGSSTVLRAGDVPDALSGIVALASEGEASIAVLSDGTVRTWGWQSEFPVVPAPPGLHSVVQADVGHDRFVALKADGTVVSWGGGEFGTPRYLPPEGLNAVVQVAAGNNTFVALRRDGSLVFWCDEPSGYFLQDFGAVRRTGYVGNLLGLLLEDGTVSVVVGGKGIFRNLMCNIVEIALRPGHILGCNAEGRVTAWDGPLGDPDFIRAGQASIPAGLGRVAAIAAGTPLGGHRAAGGAARRDRDQRRQSVCRGCGGGIAKNSASSCRCGGWAGTFLAGIRHRASTRGGIGSRKRRMGVPRGSPGDCGRLEADVASQLRRAAVPAVGRALRCRIAGSDPEDFLQPPGIL